MTPRVLEIGPFCLFKQAWPATTRFLFAGPERFALPDGPPERFGLGDLRRARGIDLIVAHTAASPPWNRGLPGRLLAPARRGDALAALAWEAARQWPPRGGPPLAVLDLHDTNTIARRDLQLLAAGARYFKRELPLDPAAAFPHAARWLDKLRPISLGLSEATLREAPAGPVEKTADVFFAGNVAHGPHRRAGWAQLAALAAEAVRLDLPEKPLPRAEFLRRCAAAWLVWSPSGLGWECFRHQEAALCGSVPLMGRPTIRRHAAQHAGEHALFYDPVAPHGLRQAVLAALADRPQLARMGLAAREHALRHHTHAALCEYVARECGVVGSSDAPE